MLAGKDLIIQHAAGLTDAVQNELDDLMEKDRSGMIVVLIDTPENLERSMPTIPLSQVNSSTSEAMRKRLNRKKAEAEMEAALKRSTEKQEQIARDVVSAEQEMEEEPGTENGGRGSLHSDTGTGNTDGAGGRTGAAGG